MLYAYQMKANNSSSSKIENNSIVGLLMTFNDH